MSDGENQWIDSTAPAGVGEIDISQIAYWHQHPDEAIEQSELQDCAELVIFQKIWTFT